MRVWILSLIVNKTMQNDDDNDNDDGNDDDNYKTLFMLFKTLFIYSKGSNIYLFIHNQW